MAKDGTHLKEISFILLLAFCLLIPHVMCQWRSGYCDDIHFVTATATTNYLRLTTGINDEYYPNYNRCWVIRARDPDHKVKISFIYFEVEKHWYCDHDWLVIYDGDDRSGDKINKFCGEELPDDIVSDSDALYLEFKSDGNEEEEGFKIAYMAGDSFKPEKKHSKTTIIVGGIIGGLVLITGCVVFICLCMSSRRCICRPGSRTVNPEDENANSHRRRRTCVTRTDSTRVSRRDTHTNSSLTQVENPERIFPFHINLPSYTGPTEPPPYNGHERVELQRLPSSPPPPYTPRDSNQLSVSLGDINVPSVPGMATSRF